MNTNISDDDSLSETFDIDVTDENNNERLDRFLSIQLSDLSRSRVKTLIKEGQVLKDDQKILEPNYRVKTGECFQITIPEAEPALPKAQNIPLNVVYEDNSLIVIDKPSGLVVHPAAGNWTGTLVNALIYHCGESLSGIGGVKRPGIVHRLDKETSGLMVVAKTDHAHKYLSEQFAAHGRDGRMTRAYKALVWGKLLRQKGVIEAALGRKDSNRQKMSVVKTGGKHAVTHYEVLETFKNDDDEIVVSLVKCILETGRTHQIRVHLSHIGHPLLGDQTYGSGFAASRSRLDERSQKNLDILNRQALHAYHIGFEHPETGEYIHFDSPFPKKIASLCKSLESR